MDTKCAFYLRNHTHALNQICQSFLGVNIEIIFDYTSI